MEIANKIKHLRYKSGLTQNQLAARLGVTAQAVSKWENSITMPDITLLPKIAIEFGISIDELFDLTLEQKLDRIEKSMELEDEFTSEVFKEYEIFLKETLATDTENQRILSLLAHLYHHRMESDAKKVSQYARKAIKIQPETKDCQWLLNMSEGQIAWDWNCFEHSKIIDFYKDVIDSDNITPPTPLPYYYLIDNLIFDHRTKEAAQYLKRLETIPAHKPFLITVYRAYIALVDFDVRKADSIIEEGLEKHSDNGAFIFEAAQYYARKCEYKKALELYETSWRLEENSKPRYTDALYGILKIYEIIGEKENALKTYDRIHDVLINEWGFCNDDRAVIELELEKNALARKIVT